MTDPSIAEPSVTLIDAARIVARGGDLDAKLGALAEQARSATGAVQVTIHLLDESGRWLVPTYLGERNPAGAPPATEQTIDLEAAPVLKSILGDRQPRIVELDQEQAPSLPFLPPDARNLAIVPLVTASDEGGAEVDGVLIAVIDPPQGDGVDDSLAAVADLAAVAIRQTRLENALVERADWLDRMANTDPLTGLANKRTFQRMLELELARASRSGSSVGLAMVEVDGLDLLRQRGGQAEVDGVLRRVAATLAEQLRLVDTVARIGPDLFALICPGSVGDEAAIRVRDAVAGSQPASADPSVEPPEPSSVSVGVARFPTDGSDAEALSAAAQRALGSARSKGPGSIVSA